MKVRTLKTVMNSLPFARRKKIEARAAKAIAKVRAFIAWSRKRRHFTASLKKTYSLQD